MSKIYMYFKNWSVFDKLLFLLCPTTLLIVGLVFKSSALTIITSIVGILTAFLVAKGLVIGQIFGIAITVLYSIVSYQNCFYGEMIIYLGIMFPMYIWGIVEWKKHENKNTQSVEVNNISAKEWILVTIFTIALFIGFYFVLKSLNTSELIVSTLSLVDNIFATYLIVRRCKYGFLSYIVNDLILIVLWGIPVFSGSLILLPMLLNPIFNFINDLYGIINWTKMQKQQTLDIN